MDLMGCADNIVWTSSLMKYQIPVIVNNPCTNNYHKILIWSDESTGMCPWGYYSNGMCPVCL